MKILCRGWLFRGLLDALDQVNDSAFWAIPKFPVLAAMGLGSAEWFLFCSLEIAGLVRGTIIVKWVAIAVGVALTLLDMFLPDMGVIRRVWRKFLDRRARGTNVSLR